MTLMAIETNTPAANVWANAAHSWNALAENAHDQGDVGQASFFEELSEDAFWLFTQLVD